MREVALLLPLVACQVSRLDEGGKGSNCEVEPTVLAADEVSALGFSAAELLSQVGPAETHTLDWLRLGGATELTIEAAWDGGEVRFLDGEPAAGSDTGGMEPAMEELCGDWLEVDVTLGFTTADGELAEAWPLALVATASDRATFVQDLDPVTLVGTFDSEEHGDPTAEYESLGAEVRGTLAVDGDGGEVTLQGEGTEDCEDDEEDCVSWASRETVGTWGESET